ncbi:MAG: hypothetical protein ACTSSP_03745 [Candidatus Asgardarchaeia archaeon]
MEAIIFSTEHGLSPIFSVSASQKTFYISGGDYFDSIAQEGS